MRSLLLTILCLFALGGCSSKKNTDSSNSVNKNLFESNSNELKMNQDELDAIGKWKNQSYDDLWRDAFAGDAAGLWNIGMACMVGHGLDLDTEMAENVFGYSASLGFAPSIRQVGIVSLENDSNPYLGLVYLNLIVSFGHPEFAVRYHDLRSHILTSHNAKNFNGTAIVNEAERIARHKKELILKNQSFYKNRTNVQDRPIFLCKEFTDITSEDEFFNMNYFFIGAKNGYPDDLRDYIKQASIPWYLKLDELFASSDDFTEEWKEAYVEIIDGILEIPKKTNNKISDADIHNYLMRNVPELLQTKEDMMEILEDLMAINSIAIMRKEAIDAILAECNNKIPVNIKELVDFQIDKKVKKIVQDFKAKIKSS